VLAQYLPVLGLLVLAVIFGVGGYFTAGLLAPRSPNSRKAAAYECGMVPAKDTPERFPVTFFLVAMIFIVFDVELIFLYPWVVANGALGAFGLFSVLVFSFLVFESFVYLISNGALEWGPVTQIRNMRGEMVDPERTATTTVRRVGLEGRTPTHQDPTEEAA
jgi:NADH-quinone oxidoreductase subunit A